MFLCIVSTEFVILTMDHFSTGLHISARVSVKTGLAVGLFKLDNFNFLFKTHQLYRAVAKKDGKVLDWRC